MLDMVESICREVEEGRLALEDVWNEYSEWIIAYSSDFSGAIEQERRKRNDPTYYASIDSVRKQLAEYCAKRKISQGIFTPEDLHDFYETEVEGLPRNFV